MAVAEPTRSRPQRRIGKYLLTGRIGRGGMGVVYRGRDEALERDVALKTLTGEGNLDAESRARFLIEAKAAARLQHPNIVTVYELGEERGLPFIAMELLGGADLESLLRSGEELLLEEKLDVIAQICRGLAFAHEHGVVHRDMKPSNVRVLDDGSAKILDFGIAKLGSTAVTKSGMMVGTVHYMSPEQIRGAALDGRSDVFSLGVILYELLGAARPFQGSEATQILYRIVHEAPAPLTGHWGAHTERLQAIVARALAKDPDARYPGATALAEDLEQVLGELRRATPALPARAQDELSGARRLLAQGHAREGLQRLEALHARHPDEVTVRRGLRAARRGLAVQTTAATAPQDDFPELDATMQAPPTLRGTATIVQDIGLVSGTPSASAPAALPAWRRPLPLALGAGALLLAGLTVLVLLLRTPADGPLVSLRSRPAGAAVWLDGRDTGVVTDGALRLPRADAPVRLTFRKAGFRDLVRELRPPFESTPLEVELQREDPAFPPARGGSTTGSARVSLRSEPPAARVEIDGAEAGRTPLTLSYDPMRLHRVRLSLEGFEPAEVLLEPGQPRAQVDVSLRASGPPGSVAITSSYPLDVVWQGRTLAREQQSPRVSLPPGRHTLTLLAPKLLLKSNVSVQVRPGTESLLEAPGLGRINVNATPDNCEVFVNGIFVDYPPIRDHPVAAGALRLTFKWPDGVQREQSADVAAGGVAFVTGRRE